MIDGLKTIYDAEDEQSKKNNQTQFDTCVSQRPANTKTYDIQSACEGVIDMAIFDGENRTPQCVKFIPGNITYLLNLPTSLKELVIDNNKLDKIPDDAQHLIKLSCGNNQISMAPHKEFRNLEELMIDNNKLIELDNLPPNLKKISAKNNSKLAFANLSNLNHCLYANFRENPELKQVIIQASQAEQPGFQLLVDPHTKVTYIDEESGISGIGGAKKKQQAEEEETEQTMDAYYALKSEYERTRIKKVHDIASKYESIKEKRQALRKLAKKCIKCGKPGDGMRFWRTNDVLHAECAAHPKCNFKMTVHAGFYANIQYLLTVTADDMSEKRANIIRLKMDTLFNYITETASKTAFQKELEMYQGDEAMNNTYKDYETLMLADPVKERLIKKKTVDMWKILKEVRIIMEVYAKTNDKRMLREAVEKQVQELYPEVAALRLLKHPVMKMVELDDGTHKLVQNNYLYEAADYKLIGI